MTRRRQTGFTLLEVLMAMAILAVSLSAVFSAEAGAIKMASRTRKISLAALLARCKMNEVEEKIAKEGMPALFASGQDKCCEDAPIDGFECKWDIEPIIMPETMFPKSSDKKPGTAGGPSASSLSQGALGALPGQLPGGALPGQVPPMGTAPGATPSPAAPGSSGSPMDLLSGTNPSQLLSGGGPMDAIASMAMQFIYPVLKTSFESQIRRATVKVSWREGSAEHSFDVTQYLVAEQPVIDPNAANAAAGTQPGGAPAAGATPGALPGAATSPFSTMGGIFK